MNARIVIASALAALALAGALFFLHRSRDPIELRFRELAQRTPVVRKLDESALTGPALRSGPEGERLSDGASSFEQQVALLRDRYGARIQHVRVQVELLEEVMGELQRRQPDAWVEPLHELLLAAFPEHAGRLFQLSASLYLYNKELSGRRDLLGAAGDDERQRILWQVRYEHFGQAAEEIWQAERQLSAIRNSLQALTDNRDLSLADKTAAYRGALEEAYGEALPTVLAQDRLAFANAFTDAMQADLVALSREERYRALRELRAAMDMEPAALHRWEVLDRERDRRRAQGEAYYTARENLENRYSGSEQAARLAILRREYFGAEAEQIQNEEEAGYYRFREPQIFGRN
jgi:hypothetical protein